MKTTPKQRARDEAAGKTIAAAYKARAKRQAQASLPPPRHPTREGWLMACVEAYAPIFKRLGYPLPDKLRVATSFPNRKASSAKGRVVGQCFSPEASQDGTVEIMISPVEADAMEITSTLVHELIHAAVGNECGHKGPFRSAAMALGLIGPMRSTVAGDEFKRQAQPIIDALGRYPHAKLDVTNQPKQTTRLLKAWCTSLEDSEDGKECGYTVRVTKRWVLTLGAPHCPLHGEMYVEVPDEYGNEEDY
jgi:hypothetical protein